MSKWLKPLGEGEVRSNRPRINVEEIEDKGKSISTCIQIIYLTMVATLKTNILEEVKTLQPQHMQTKAPDLFTPPEVYIL